jgi:hypothetical protein
MSNEIFRPQDMRHDAAHEAVKGLGVQAILTTNYDSLIESADGPPRRERYTWMEAPKVLNELNSDRRILFTIHGTAERRESVVMSFQEYDNLRNNGSYQAVLRYLLQANLFLFIGYGMNDPLDLDLALSGNLKAFGDSIQTHYVLLKQATNDDCERLQNDFNVKVIPYAEHEQVTDFLKSLIARRNNV